MLSDLPGSTAVAIVALMAPASFVWWFGWTLSRTPDDPLLSERLVVWRRRGRVVLGASWAAMTVFGLDMASWGLALMIFLRGAAAYPLRRTLYAETWSIHRYLWFFGRLIVALYGFWLLLLQTPVLVLAAGTNGVWVGALLAIMLLLWSARYSDVFSFVIRTRPPADQALLDRFRDIANRAGIATPTVEVVDMNGGVLANALAFPSRRRPSVVMTSTLIERFDADEIAAVYAHELAHIEHYDTRRMRLLNLGNRAMVLAGVLSGLAGRLVDRATAASMTFVWFVAVMMVIAWRARTRQKEETASDLRAIALTGQPEALVTALSKLHTIGRVPRRWEPRVERHATHPSLARRIQAIRSAAGCVPDGLRLPSTFVCGGTALAFHRDRLVWTEGDGATHSFSYEHLIELRLDVKRRAAPRLVAVECGGRRWQTSVGSEDASHIQAALDVVDGRLAAGAPPPAAAIAPVRLLCVMSALLSVSALQFAVLLPAALAAMRPASPLVSATAVATVVAAAIGWFEETGAAGWYVPALAACGGALVFMSWLLRKDDDQPTVTGPLALLSISVACVWAILLLSGTNPIQLHQSSRNIPAVAILTFALAAALLMLRSRAARIVAAPVGLAAIAVIVLGSHAYLERFGKDPFLASAAPLAIETIDGPIIAETRISDRPTTLRVSPAGRSVAFAFYSPQARRTLYQLGRSSGPFTMLRAETVLFVDDDHALLLESTRDNLVVRAVSVDEPEVPVWEHRIDNGRWGRLSLNQRTRQWRVVGRNRDSDIIRVDGRIGESIADQQLWPADADDDEDEDFVDAVSASASRVLMQRTHYPRELFGGWFNLLSTLVGPTSTTSDFWTLGPDGAKPFGATRLDVECDWMYGPGDRPVCLAFDGWRTTLFSFDLVAGRLEPMRSVVGGVTSTRDGGSGWISGWWKDGAVALRVDGREAIRVAAPEGGYIATIAAADRAVAAVSVVRQEPVLTVHARALALSVASR